MKEIVIVALQTGQALEAVMNIHPLSYALLSPSHGKDLARLILMDLEGTGYPLPEAITQLLIHLGRLGIHMVGTMDEFILNYKKQNLVIY